MKHPILRALSIRSFSYLMLSELFSQIAMNLLNFVLLILVFNLVRSSIAVSGVILAFTIPALFFGILAGIYVDRWNKKHVLFYTNLLRAILVFPLFFLNTSIFSIYAIIFLVSLVTQFFIPAEAPIIPLIVERKLLFSANALFSMGIFASILIAYAVSGPFLLFFGDSNGFIMITALFLFSSFFAYFIRMKKNHITESIGARRVRLDFRKTLRLLGRIKKVTASLFILTLLQTVVLSIAVVGPGFAENILKIRVEEFPVLFITPSVIGMGIGALLLGNFFHEASKRFMVRLGMFIIGASLLFSPYVLSLAGKNIIYAAITLAFFMGIAFALIFIPANTVVQEQTSDQMRGKVYGVLNTLVGGVSAIPVLAVGGVSDVFGVEKVLFFMGFTLLSISLIRWGIK
ncbi:MAG: MFS transporter [Patescibacteria group bacterium]